MVAMQHEDIELNCLRFILAHGSVAVAWEKLKQAIDWRLRHKTWEITQKKFVEKSFVHCDKISKCLGGLIGHEFTKDGRVLTLEFIGRVNVELLTSTISLEEFKQYAAELIVTSARNYDRLSREKDVLMELVYVVDLSGIGMSQISYLTYYQQQIYIGELISPETAGAAVILSAPPFFDMIWATVKTWLSPNTTKKVRIFGTDGKGQAFLASLLEPRNTPRMFGGPLITSADKWLEENNFLFEEATVTAGKKVKVSRTIEKPGAKVKWTFNVVSLDVGVTVQYVAEKGKKKTVIMSNSKQVALSEPLTGEFSADEPGVFEMEFDNTYSMWNSKRCRYFIGQEQ
jgi:hypothetical protein